ncbi:MAG TPA: sugar ABC transporter ATP-binding protein [Candidatus Limnocylindrales bacterium]
MTIAERPEPLPNASDDDHVLTVAGIRKVFPGTIAVDIDPEQRLDFRRGEIHGLVGENGAGKSTLVGIIAGLTRPTDGSMTLLGRSYAPTDPVDARAQGVDIVLQEPGLVDTMTVEENLLLGREQHYAPRVVFRSGARRRMAVTTMRHMRRSVPMGIPAGRLSLEDQKFVELARALSLEPKVLVIDEMTANLTQKGLPELFEILRAFRDGGGTVIYISHYLDEVSSLCDRVTVMKDGRLVRTMDAAGVTEDQLSILMVGRDIRGRMYRTDTDARTSGEALLEIDGLTLAGRYTDVSFTLHRGEVLGIGGLIGCGSESLALSLFGDIRPDSGEVRMHGRPVRPGQPRDAIRSGIAYVPGDRDREGLILNLSLERNVALAALPWLQRLGFVRPGRERGIARRLIGELGIVSRSESDIPFSLSGGNRQKVVLAKWLVRNNDVLILHNPTRGVDVGGKADIYALIRRLADGGAGIILISDELPELIGMSDTMLMMRRGKVSATIARNEQPTEERLIGYMV